MIDTISSRRPADGHTTASQDAFERVASTEGLSRVLALIVQNLELLLQVEELVRDLAPSSYCRPVNERGGSIGEQTRHLLDCVDALVSTLSAAGKARSVNYVVRHRGALDERDQAAAIRRIRALKNVLGALPHAAFAGLLARPCRRTLNRAPEGSGLPRGGGGARS